MSTNSEGTLRTPPKKAISLNMEVSLGNLLSILAIVGGLTVGYSNVISLIQRNASDIQLMQSEFKGQNLRLELIITQVVKELEKVSTTLDEAADVRYRGADAERDFSIIRREFGTAIDNIDARIVQHDQVLTKQREDIDAITDQLRGLNTSE